MTTNHLPRKLKDTKPKRPVRQHPNIVALFEYRYRVLMNQMDVMPLEERREFGTVSSGDKKIDKAMAVSYIPVYLTINEMIMNYEKVIPMRLAEPRDAKKIFEAIIAHTGAWREALKHVMNVGSAPVEDLITMENFAASIYERAKFVYVERPKTNFHQGSLAAFLYSNNGVTGNMFNSTRNSWSSSAPLRQRADVRDQAHTPNISVFRDVLMTTMTFEDE